MSEKKQSKWYWRGLRRVLIGLACLATLVAAVITEENWRGKHDWAAYKRAAAARGEPLDWAAFFPTPVADGDNFVKAPIFAGLAGTARGSNAVDALTMSPERTDGSSPEGASGSWELARMTDLKKWQDYYRRDAGTDTNGFPTASESQSPSADILLALSKYGPALNELRLASRRPYSRFGSFSPSDPSGTPLTMEYFARLKGCVRVLQLRAKAELADHQETNALEDVQLLFALDDKLRQEPLLISHLVSIAFVTISLDPIYEGLAQHLWNDAQLIDLEHLLATRDFLADYQYAMQGERIFAIEEIENMRITREYVTADAGNDSRGVTNSLGLTPSAFFYQTELAFARMNDEFLRPLVDATNHIISPVALRQANLAMQEQMKHYSPYTAQAKMAFPAISRSVVKFALAQADVDLARTACALERYRLAHDGYPATLDVLVPHFIENAPHDVINGQPLRYRPTDDGKFILYSVGWNETDDGGTVATNKNGTVDHERGDWVWKD